MTDAPEVPLVMRRDGFNPVDELARFRDAEGIRKITFPFGESAYLVARYDDIRKILSDNTRFGIVAADYPDVSEQEQARMRAGQLLDHDPPEHTRLRRMLTPEFTVRRMQRLQSRIVEVVDDALDTMEAIGPPADLVSAFAQPVPALVICELLGVPYSDREEFQQRAVRMLDPSLSQNEYTALFKQDLQYMAGLVAQAQTNAGDDILGALVRNHGHDLSADELAGIGELVLFAGDETTSNMISLGTLALLRHPDQLAMVRDDLALVEPAIEELLRWLTIVHTGMSRVTKTEVRLAGHTIPAGAQLILALPAVNRDPAFVGAPERLDITRGAPGHVAFGHGVHHCLGAPLARLEMRIAFPALLRRFPDLALAVPFEDIEFRATTTHGVYSLPVTW